MNLSFWEILLSLLASMVDLGPIVAAEAVDLSRSRSFHEELPIPPALSRRVQEDFSKPTISFSNLQMEMVHTVGDDVRSDEVRIDLFEDRDCSVPLTNRGTPYIAVDAFGDLTDDGDGSGARQMTVQYTINPTVISGSPIITYTSEGTVVSFCTRFSLIDPSRPNETIYHMDYPVALYIDILQRFEIIGLVPDGPEDSFGVEAFLCDSNNLRINETDNTGQRHQGSRVRICVRPDSYAKDSGVVLKTINRLKLIRGNVSQDVLVANGVVQKDMVGDYYYCLAGESICYVETELSNRFFFSQGFVRVEGDVWLQYSFSNRRRNVGLTSTQLVSDTPPVENRRDTETGSFIGSRNFALQFEVDPLSGATTWEAEAFLCNGRNERLQQGAVLIRSQNDEDGIRVCFMPQQPATREWGIYIREISSFSFEQGDNVQVAIEPSGTLAENSIFICNAGEPLCVLKATLSKAFFGERKNVIGQGELVLQYGTEPRARVFNGHALLQNEGNSTVDPGFAGRVKVSIQFAIDPGYHNKDKDWWHRSGVFLRMMYVMVVLIGFLIFLCCLFATCFGNSLSGTNVCPSRWKRPRRLVLPLVVGMDTNTEKGPLSSKSDMSIETSPHTADDTCTTETRTTHGRLTPEPTQKTESADSKTKDKSMRKKVSEKLMPDAFKSPAKQCRRVEGTDRVWVPQSPKRQIPKRVSMSPMSDDRCMGHEPGNGTSSLVARSPRKLRQKLPQVQSCGNSPIKSTIPRKSATPSRRSPSTLNAPDQPLALQNYPPDLNMASTPSPTRSGKRPLDPVHAARVVSFPMKIDLDVSSKAKAPSSDRPTATPNRLSTSAGSSSIIAMTSPQTSQEPSGQKTQQRPPPVPCASPGGRRATLSASRSNHRRKTLPLLLDLDDDDDDDEEEKKTKNHGHENNIPNPLAC